MIQIKLLELMMIQVVVGVDDDPGKVVGDDDTPKEMSELLSLGVNLFLSIADAKRINSTFPKSMFIVATVKAPS